jgi:hypothetical protein
MGEFEMCECGHHKNRHELRSMGHYRCDDCRCDEFNEPFDPDSIESMQPTAIVKGERLTRPDADALLRRVHERVGAVKIWTIPDGPIFVGWGPWNDRRNVPGPTLAAALQAVLEREEARDA